MIQLLHFSFHYLHVHLPPSLPLSPSILPPFLPISLPLYLRSSHSHPSSIPPSIPLFCLSISLFPCTSGKCSQEAQEVRTAHAETISELDKTRKLLALQNTISRDCKREVEALQAELREVRAVYDKRLEEGAQLLDIRQARIKVRCSYWVGGFHFLFLFSLLHPCLLTPCRSWRLS